MDNTIESRVPPLAKNWLKLDACATVERIESAIRDQVFVELKRKGVVIALSGGIDSSVVAALCARAVGKDRVVGIIMPERESPDEALQLALLLAGSLRLRVVVKDITGVLEATGCYQLRDTAIRMLAPSYGPNHRCKLVRTAASHDSPYLVPSIVIEDPHGKTEKVRLNKDAYLQIVAATNFKQRVRKMIEYAQADQSQFAVAGTANRLEYDQGFFVKSGDGLADLKPIAHLYKSQVYDLAEYLDIPGEIRLRPSTTDTFPLSQTQEEFYFGIPLRSLDLCLYARNNGLSVEDTAESVGLPPATVSSIFARIEANRRATSYLHERTLFVEPIDLSCYQCKSFQE